MGHLQNIPGVLLIASASVIAETLGFSWITTAKHWAIITGYVVMHSESDSEGKTRISKKGNRHIPAIVHMPTRSTIPTNPTRAILQSPEYEKGQIDNRTRVDTRKALNP